MKKFIILPILILSLSAEAFTVVIKPSPVETPPPNPTQQWKLFYFDLHPVGPKVVPPMCPKVFCRIPDDGFSWRNWCANLDPSTRLNVVPAGETRFNGVKCLCSCWESRRE